MRKYFLDRARPWLRKIYPVVPAGFDFLEKYYGVTRAEMTLLPLGSDQEFARQVQASDARQRGRSQLGLTDGALVIFTGGKLTPLKRTEDLLAAVNTLNGGSHLGCATSLMSGSHSGNSVVSGAEINSRIAAGKLKIHDQRCPAKAFGRTDCRILP